MRLTNDQKTTIEHFRKRPGMLVAGKDGSNPGDDIYTVIRSALDYASAESGKEVDLKLVDGTVCLRVYGSGKESEDELSRVICQDAQDDLLYGLSDILHQHTV